MSVSKAAALLSLVALLVLTIYQHSGVNVAAQNSTLKGTVLVAIWLILALATWLIALANAYSNNQRACLVAIFLLWPSMYIYVFRNFDRHREIGG